MKKYIFIAFVCGLLFMHHSNALQIEFSGPPASNSQSNGHDKTLIKESKGAGMIARRAKMCKDSGMKSA